MFAESGFKEWAGHIPFSDERESIAHIKSHLMSDDHLGHLSLNGMHFSTFGNDAFQKISILCVYTALAIGFHHTHHNTGFVNDGERDRSDRLFCIMDLKVKRLSKTAIVPQYAHDDDAGLDLFVAETLTLAPGERGQVKTGIAVAIPQGYAGLIWDKSGVSHNGGIKTLGGVIDAGYRGEILIGVVNVGAESYTFAEGGKAAQLLIQAIERVVVVESDVLDETLRGERGFGSTGV